jgi:two-component system OmpR family response regulator
MALITYLVEDNQIVLDNLIEALQEIASVEVTGHGATQAEASRWLKRAQRGMAPGHRRPVS